MRINWLKPMGNHVGPVSLDLAYVWKLYIPPTRCNCAFLHTEDVYFSFWGTNWIFLYYLDEFKSSKEFINILLASLNMPEYNAQFF
jgi:hypothetical protein